MIYFCTDKRKQAVSEFQAFDDYPKATDGIHSVLDCQEPPGAHTHTQQLINAENSYQLQYEMIFGYNYMKLAKLF